MGVVFPADLVGDEVDRGTRRRGDDPVEQRVVVLRLG
jgi:hypothetical protein